MGHSALLKNCIRGSLLVLLVSLISCQNQGQSVSFVKNDKTSDFNKADNEQHKPDNLKKAIVKKLFFKKLLTDVLPSVGKAVLTRNDGVLIVDKLLDKERVIFQDKEGLVLSIEELIPEVNYLIIENYLNEKEKEELLLNHFKNYDDGEFAIKETCHLKVGDKILSEEKMYSISRLFSNGTVEVYPGNDYKGATKMFQITAESVYVPCANEKVIFVDGHSLAAPFKVIDLDKKTWTIQRIFEDKFIQLVSNRGDQRLVSKSELTSQFSYTQDTLEVGSALYDIQNEEYLLSEEGDVYTILDLYNNGLAQLAHAFIDNLVVTVDLKTFEHQKVLDNSKSRGFMLDDQNIPNSVELNDSVDINGIFPDGSAIIERESLVNENKYIVVDEFLHKIENKILKQVKKIPTPNGFIAGKVLMASQDWVLVEDESGSRSWIKRNELIQKLFSL